MDEIDLVIRAKVFATAKHEGQTRKYQPEVPYVTHPLKVAEMLQKIRDIPELVAAALLHDVVEDTSTTIEEIKTHFGEKVASLVAELTSDKKLQKQMGKAKYLTEKIRYMSLDARLIKLLDREHNVSDLNTDANISDLEHSDNFARRYSKETKEILDNLNLQLSPEELTIIKRIREKISPFLSDAKL